MNFSNNFKSLGNKSSPLNLNGVSQTFGGFSSNNNNQNNTHNNNTQNNNENYIELTKTSQPFNFSGDDLTIAKLINSQVTDFNVFTKRNKFKHNVKRLTFNDTQVLKTPICNSSLLSTIILTHFGGPIEVRFNFDVMNIDDGDSCIIDNDNNGNGGGKDITLTSIEKIPIDLFYTTIEQVN